MRVDWQTIQDLGILRPEGYQASLYDWLNFTRTHGGAALLKERVRSPMSQVAALRETQAAVAWLAAHAELFDGVMGRNAWQTIEHYVDSTVAALDYPNPVFMWLDSWWVRHRRRDLYREVGAGLSLAQTLTVEAAALADALRPLELPGLLAAWRAELSACLKAPALVRLRGSPSVHRLRPPRTLALDRSLRTDRFVPLRELASLVYRLDALRSLALATRNHGLRLPEIVEEGGPLVEAEGLYHPLLEKPVGNPFRANAGGRLIFLTGPNMAGKSTYLKAAGVAVYLAQLGMGVPARSLRFTPFECLFSGIHTTDNLRLGHSYFYREVRRVREIVDILGSGASAFVLFDEMFKGTNLKDASDACMAVLSGFSACDTSVFLVASHLAELASGIERLPAARFLHFGAEIRGREPFFDYAVRDGVSEQRLGMLILEREGVLRRLEGLQAPAVAP